VAIPPVVLAPAIARAARARGWASPHPRRRRGWSIWIGAAISTRMTDVRAAAQLSALASLLTIAVPSLIAFNVIHATLALTVGLAAALLLLDGLGWRIVAAMFGANGS
jgi:hypothetical protein